MKIPLMLPVIMRGIRFLFRDSFTTALTAGNVNGSAAEPGPGNRTVVDTANHITVAGGRLISDGYAGSGDPRVYVGPFTRVAGLTAKWNLHWVTSRGFAGWKATTAAGAVNLGVGDVSAQLVTVPPNQPLAQFSISGDYTVWATFFGDVGGAVWVQGVVHGVTETVPILMWVDDTLNAASYYFFPVAALSTDCQLQSDSVEIAIVQNRATRQSIAAAYISNPDHGVNYDTYADALHYLTFTLPGSPSAGDTIELRYRYQDATNYYTAYIKRNVGNTAWDFFVDEVVAGTPTNKITATGIGTPTDMCVMAIGPFHAHLTREGANWTERGNTFSDATFQTETEAGPWFTAGTASLYQAYKRRWTL